MSFIFGSRWWARFVVPDDRDVTVEGARAARVTEVLFALMGLALFTYGLGEVGSTVFTRREPFLLVAGGAKIVIGTGLFLGSRGVVGAWRYLRTRGRDRSG